MRDFKILIFFLLVFLFGQKKDQIIKNPSSNIGIKNNIESNLSFIPKRLSYQGLLTKSNGQPVPDGSYLVKFTLYSSANGDSFFWEESQTISIDDGLINTVLGETTPIESIPNQAYLEINIDGTILSPRQEMTSVFYAMVSDTAKYSEGGDYSDLDNLPDLSIFSKILFQILLCIQI